MLLPLKFPPFSLFHSFFYFDDVRENQFCALPTLEENNRKSSWTTAKEREAQSAWEIFFWFSLLLLLLLSLVYKLRRHAEGYCVGENYKNKKINSFMYRVGAAAAAGEANSRFLVMWWWGLGALLQPANSLQSESDNKNEGKTFSLFLHSKTQRFRARLCWTLRFIFH